MFGHERLPNAVQIEQLPVSELVADMDVDS